MSKVKGIIRVDGSDTIGMGHVMRCLYLVQELSASCGLNPLFVMRKFPLGVAWVERQGHTVSVVPADCSREGEIARVCELIEECRPAFLLTDLRDLTGGLVETVKALGVLCFSIDEWGGRAIVSDILTNGTIVPSWHKYQLEGDVHCYIGADYALLHDQFVEAHERKRDPHDGRFRVLIALGGDDPFDLSVKTMAALEKVSQVLDNVVVIGPAFTNQSQIREAATRSKHRYRVYENTNEMAALMMEADIGITGGGLIALELACTGTPGLICCEVDHQLDTADVLQERGAAINLGLGTALDEESYAGIVSDLLKDAARRKEMEIAGRRLIDGKGCRRLAGIITSALKERGLL